MQQTRPDPLELVWPGDVARLTSKDDEVVLERNPNVANGFLAGPYSRALLGSHWACIRASPSQPM